MERTLIECLLGVVLLTMGGRLFWLFIGVVGFIFGFDLAGVLLYHQPHDLVLIVALIIGLVCAFLAVSLQKIAVAVGGFLAGGHLFPELLKILGIEVHWHYWVLFVLGGIIGAVLMFLAFDFALALLSSLIGAHLILQALHLEGKTFIILFVILSAMGFALQYGLVSPGPRGKTRPR